MLVGECGSGKSSLICALSGEKHPRAKAMSVVYVGQFINTPGEFLENRRFYPALITAAVDCDILALVQDATRKSSLFPPQFCSAFNCRKIGIISKIDAEQAAPQRAEQFLRYAGARDIIRLSVKSGEGVDELKALLA